MPEFICRPRILLVRSGEGPVNSSDTAHRLETTAHQFDAEKGLDPLILLGRGEEEPSEIRKGKTMTYETETTKTLTDRELAEVIVDDRIACGQFCKDDREWLVERELRETRESLVNAFNAIERWADTDTTDTDENDDFMWDEMEQEEAHGALFDGDLGQLLGDWEWQYDTDAIVDMITVYDPATCQTYHKLEDDMPDIDEIDEATMWAPITENIEHIMEWYNSRSDIEICDVDDEMVLDALTETDDEGNLIWKPLTCSQVESVIYDLALLTSDNMGTSLAEDICDERLDEMWEVIAWAGATPLDMGDDEELGLGRIWYSLTEPHGVWDTPDWKHMTREQTYDAIKAIVG